jgi:hypothetical protein
VRHAELNEEDVMVVLFRTKNGAVGRGPPYTAEEEAEQYGRVAKGPVQMTRVVPVATVKPPQQSAGRKRE